MTAGLMLRLGAAFVVALAGLLLGASHSIHITNEHVGVAIALAAVIYAYREIGRYFDDHSGH
ncbi:MAG TPA: hypothetical protein VD970_03905 [Acetobacteraceae bacterium]|nr:hypothetical protein [Acetobacteraceae bacterium]